MTARNFYKPGRISAFGIHILSAAFQEGDFPFWQISREFRKALNFLIKK